jgi:Ras-related GTP-binding protein A/B
MENSEQSDIRKVLLMGPGNSGKSSMRSIIFANHLARETRSFSHTVSVDRGQVRFLGTLTLNIWDCGGQIEYYKTYFSTEKETIFSNVSVLIFVLDVKSLQVDEDLEEYVKCVECLKEFSKQAKLFVLVHKMDLVPKEDRKKIYRGISKSLKQISLPFKITTYQTSIWEETLYEAWSNIIYSLIPNADLIHKHLTDFMTITEAEEVVIFEKATFLNISHATQPRSLNMYKDIHRFEKISNIVKLFKLSCIKTGISLNSMRVHSTNFDAFLMDFTSNTYIMVIIADPEVRPAATMLNIANARPHFEKLLAHV